MPISFRSPINFFNDRNRYCLLIIFHLIESVTFWIRFIILYSDLSAVSDRSSIDRASLAYLVPILLIELCSSFIVFLLNCLYLITKCCSNNLFDPGDQLNICCRRRTLWRISTMTCFKFYCYHEHPQAILLTRLFILFLSFFLRFIAFVLGASCASRYNPRAVAYTVTSSLSLPSSTMTLVTETAHFFRLWTYSPNNQYNTPGYQTYRSHLRFIPYGIVNDQQTTEWNASLCDLTNCESESLHHLLLYHSLAVPRQIPVINDNQIVIAFYQTTKNDAYKIARDGFTVTGPRTLTLAPDVYFTISIERSRHRNGAIICARINVGRVVTLKGLNMVPLESFSVHATDSVYHQPSGKIQIRTAKQIDKWIITIRDQTEDRFDAGMYKGCI
ncbi:unnamed protein product [Didymodactylos carnosus]|uniref:Uncharacterized protein n=1 Tax=Didymodactylos carnosus TaxID=1234261 RepID=A0A815ML59_9BILA|nr:unnamed protein product [Didymodactylos carnosus]CAF1424210.1 unnamed protein product [Didymodactylos carnosus]CAF3816283.1 unnamed protein product [Didymodactylos carnosus]CAF4305685.1 unnamed protein product [Didymodactylos carnosus]